MNKNYFFPYYTIEDIKRVHEIERGGHFFTNEAKRFFNSKIYNEVYGFCFFVTSEKDGGLVWDGKRRYTVRAADDTGEIFTVGEFGEFATKRGAENKALRLGRQLLNGEDVQLSEDVVLSLDQEKKAVRV